MRSIVVMILVAEANERLLKISPRESGHRKGKCQGQHGNSYALQVIDLRLSVKEYGMGKVVEGVVEDVYAIRDTSQPAKGAPTHDAGYSRGGLGNQNEQENAIEERQPA